MEGAVLIDQRFRLGRVVRESRGAVVYEAKHRNGAEAWIKLPRGPEHANALTTEARIANTLGPNAVNVRDDGVTPAGLPYLVLEPVRGQPLDHWRAHNGGRAPPEEAMGLGDELCDVIARMHRAGFSIGELRADAIVVLPKGGICLLELEHAKPITPALAKEDVERVGCVLYEMLSGIACLSSFPPLREQAPELPVAMAMTVDDAARGRHASIEELQIALRSSMPQWLGPMRKPMPSVPPEPDAPLGFAEIVLPRSSGALFDPAGLVETIRTGQMPKVDAAMLDALARPSRPSSELEAPPVAHSAVRGPMSTDRSNAGGFDRSQAGGAPKRRSSALVIAGVCVSAVVLGGATFAAVVTRRADAERPPPVAKAAESAVMLAAASPPVSSPAVSQPAPPPAVRVAAAPDVAAPGDIARKVSVTTAPPASAKAAGDSTETTFEFEGDLSPRLVILDGAAVGVTTKSVKVRCGTHSVKIGGKGVARSIDLPCGGELGIMIKRNGTWHPR